MTRVALGLRIDRMFLLLALLVVALGALRVDAQDDAWVIEGENLTGSKAGGTEILQPRILHGAVRITAQNGRIDSDRDVVFLYGNLHIVDTTRTLRAEQGTYRRSTRVLDLVGQVVGDGPEGQIEAGQLNYDRLSGVMKLRDHPVLSDSASVIRAERIDYWRDSLLALASGNVQILLREDSTWVYGREARYNDRTGEVIVTGDPWVRSPGEGADSALVVHADTLVLFQGESRGEALGSVRIDRGSVRAEAGRADFRLDQHRIVLTREPVAWETDGEIAADTMTITVRSGRADLLRALGNVRVRYQPASKSGELNVVLGDTLSARLDGERLGGLEVMGSAHSLYVPTEEDARGGSGRNVSSARKINVFLRGGEARAVELVEDAVGVYWYPGDRALETLRSRDALDSLRAIDPEVDPEVDPESDPETVPGIGSGAIDVGWPRPLSRLEEMFIATRTLEFGDSTTSPYDALFDQRVDYSGDTIRFYASEEKIRLLGNAKIAYQESSLDAGDIEYLADRRLVIAQSSPTIRDGESEVKGGRMTYRTDLKEGFVYQGRTEFDGGFYSGKEVKKLPDNSLLVRNGTYTTCDHEPPHYEFRSSRMKLKQDDKVVARPVIMRILDIPVMALPYYFFPIKKGRHSGMLAPTLEFGFNQYRGRFVRGFGYYWAINDYMDTQVTTDYEENGNRLYLNGEYRYRMRYLLDGQVKASYSRQGGEGASGRRGYSVQGEHRQDLGEKTRLTANANFTSSLSYRGDRDFGAGVDELLNRQLRSSLGLSRSWSGASLTVNVARNEYLDSLTASGEKVRLEPRVDLSLNQRSLGRAADARGRGGRLPLLSSTYVNTSFGFRATDVERWSGKREENQAVEQRFGLSDSRSVGHYLRINPSISGNAAWFAEDARGERNRAGASWSARVGAKNDLYGTWLSESGRLAGVRHVLTPSASWNYAPEIRSLTYADSSGVRRSRFPSVGGIGLGGTKASSMSLSLSQRLHFKFRDGTKVIKKDNLLSWDMSSSYNFLAQGKTRPMSSIRSSVQVRPFSLLDVRSDWSHNPYTRAPERFSLDTTLRLSAQLFAGAASDSGGAGPELNYGDFGGAAAGTGSSARSPNAGGGSWNLSASHSYSTQRGVDDARNNLNLGCRFNATRNWKVDGSVYLDLEAKEVNSHRFTLSRDLHCWELYFSHISRGANSEYQFRINLKDIEEVKYVREKR
ncbi:MAG: hypothetical protein IPK72_05335 [Candidatus Eisenbacteria bacterium]|nr:hypothetical protein [Candidatus Eisenbacteria bacterium]